jgi:hypothetical protein
MLALDDQISKVPWNEASQTPEASPFRYHWNESGAAIVDGGSWAFLELGRACAAYGRLGLETLDVLYHEGHIKCRNVNKLHVAFHSM